MGSNGSNVKSAGGFPPSGGQMDCGEYRSAYGGRRVGISPSGRRPIDSMVMAHKGVHTEAAGHHCGTHCLPDHI